MRKVILILFAWIAFSSCSYLPEEGTLPPTLKEDRADYSVYYSGSTAPERAFLMVPGGLVDPHVYTCWIDRLVTSDPSVAVVLVKYPSNLAITNSGKAMKVARELTQFSHWAIGGHSLGGVVAASLVHDHAGFFDGLVLMASWSREATDLSGWENPVLSLYGSEDGIATVQEVRNNSPYLPPGIDVASPDELGGLSAQTAYFEITGGNHSGFGCYGLQKGDREALIAPADQQEQMIRMIRAYFARLWQ